MGTVKAWINPLLCPEIDDPQVEVTPAALLDYLFAPEGQRTVAAFEVRYQELGQEAHLLPLAPAEDNILRKIVWPLRSARGSYSLGHSLSCIAMSGMVGEMVAVLLWDISKPAIQGELSDERERQLLGRSFERLGQERRIEVLMSLGIVQPADAATFSELKAIRNRYLHLLSHPHDSLDRDARKSFECAARLVQLLFSVQFQHGDVMLRPELAKYLQAIGVLSE